MIYVYLFIIVCVLYSSRYIRVIFLWYTTMPHFRLGVGSNQLQTTSQRQPFVPLFFGSLLFYGWNKHAGVEG